MRVFHLIGCAAALSATVAGAETQHCTVTSSSTLSCHSLGDSSMSPQPMAGYAALGGFIHRMRERGLASKVGKMIAAGDCQGAFSYALEKGRFDLASQIQQMCAAR